MGSGSDSGSGSGSDAVTGCALPWGGNLAEGASVTAYGNPIAATGSTYGCASETRTCTNGTLSGFMMNAACSGAPTTCDVPWGGTIDVGQSVIAYREPYSPHCTDTTGGSMQTRTCGANGLLSGSNTYSSCAPDATNDCVLNGHLVPYHTSMTVYAAEHPAGVGCSAGQIECVNGDIGGIEWSGAYNDRFVTCTTGATECVEGATSDLLGTDGVAYTRRCTGSVIVDHNNGAVPYATNLSMFGDVFGYEHNSNETGWPGTFAGFSPSVSMGEHEYISLRMTPSSGRTIQLVRNPSYSMLATATISRRPGVFDPKDPDMVCSQFQIVTSSGWPDGSGCLLSSDPQAVYYLNIAPYPGTDCSATGGQCATAFTLYYVY